VNTALISLLVGVIFIFLIFLLAVKVITITMFAGVGVAGIVMLIFACAIEERGNRC